MLVSMYWERCSAADLRSNAATPTWRNREAFKIVSGGICTIMYLTKTECMQGGKSTRSVSSIFTTNRIYPPYSCINPFQRTEHNPFTGPGLLVNSKNSPSNSNHITSAIQPAGTTHMPRIDGGRLVNFLDVYLSIGRSWIG